MTSPSIAQLKIPRASLDSDDLKKAASCRTYFIKGHILFPLALGIGAERHGRSMTKNDISSRHFQRKISQFCETYRADCIQAGAGEHPALPGQLDYLPEIAPAPEWPYRLDDDQSDLRDRSRFDGRTEKAAAARPGCNHPVARCSTSGRRETAAKADSSPGQDNACQKTSLRNLNQKA